MNTEAKQAAAELNEAAAPILRRVQKSSASLTNALREALGRWNHKAKWSDEVRDRLAAWIESANVEGLAEWLEAGEWEKLTPEDAGEIEARFIAAWGTAREPALMMAPVTLTDPKDPEAIEHFAMLWAAFPWIPRTTPKELHGPFQMAAAALLEAVAERAFDEAQKTAPATWDPGLHPYALGLDCLAAWMAEPGGRITLAEDCLHKGKKPDKGKDWLALLAWPWLKEQAGKEEAKADARAEAIPFAIQPRNVVLAGEDGAAFLRFPNALKDAVAWVRDLVEVDAAAFAPASDIQGLTLYKPRAWTVAPDLLATMNKPGQMLLPGFPMEAKTNLDLSTFLAVSAADATATQAALPGVCSKLLPLLFGLCPTDGRSIGGTYADLVKLVYPDYKTRRAGSKDVERVGAASAALHSLRIVRQMDGNRARVFPLLSGGFYEAYKGKSHDAGVCFRLNPELLDMMKPEKGKGDFFLVNLSRLMDLDATDPVSIAVAMRLFAYWHTCKQRGIWMPDRLDFLPVDALLVTANAVSGRVAEVMTGAADHGQAGKVQLAKDRAAMLDRILPKLSAAGILPTQDKIETRRPAKGSRGTQWQVKVPPPDDYMEASRKAARLPRK